MSRNLDRLHEAVHGLELDERATVENFLLGWVAGSTPEAMWDAGLREALDLVAKRAERRRITPV